MHGHVYVTETLLVEPRFGTSNQWMLFADPNVLPVLHIAHLSGQDGPRLAQRQGWEVEGLEFKVVLDVGIGVSDWRGAYRNAGA